MQTGRAKSHTATKLKRALRESEERLDRILRGSNDGFWDWNVTTGELYLSPRWFEILGYQASDLEPHFRTLEALCYADDLPILMGALNAHLEDSASPQVEIEHRVRTKSGDWKWILTRGCVGARDEHGQAVHMAGTATDITSRKQAEEDLREHRDLLDELVAQRTMELAETNARLQSDIVRRKQAEEELHASNAMLTEGLEREQQITKQLEVAKQEAESASQAKSEFLANMSHEIRTPMNGIMGMTQLVLDTELTAEQREYLSTAAECAEALLTLVNDILDFSKVEAGQLDLDMTEFDPAAVLGGTLDLVKHRAADKSLELIGHVRGDVPNRLRGDPGRLRQMLVNLAGNAVKFTEHGEVVIAVEVEKREENAVTLLFSVRDMGIGIPAEQQDAIFSRFTQADGTITRKFGGTGLGLAICKQLIDLMQGDIWVESQVGRGSLFSFRVTFEVIGDDGAAQTGARAHREEVRTTLRGRRLLIVDDNATSRRVLCETFADWGCSPESAAGGSAAIDQLASAAAQGSPFDLVILDVQMPDVDGLRVEQTLRSESTYGEPAVVLLGSLGSENDDQDIEASSRTRCLSKPIKQAVLWDMLAEILGHGSASPAAEETERRPAAAPHGGPVRVLLVEDNLVNQKVARGILSKCHCDVTTADNGRIALEILEQSRFDLVLMDVQMSELDGLEATRRIRADSRWHDLPVIAMTAHAMKGDREQCLEAGMNDYLTKPVKADELQKMVEKWGPPSSQSIKSMESSLYASPVAAEDDSRTEPPLAVQRVLEQLGGDAELVDEAVAAFIDDAPRLIDQLRSAAADTDAARFRMAAHSLRGAASSICADPMQRVSQQLEQLGKNDGVRDSDPLLRELEDHLARLQAFVASLNDG